MASKPKPHRLVIDIREFMSSLPAVLHQQGIQLCPVTLKGIQLCPVTLKGIQLCPVTLKGIQLYPVTLKGIQLCPVTLEGIQLCPVTLEGIQLCPVTLEVGDYILSPEMCVERKAIPDLIQSLNSGRLYNQAESMSKHYKTPILLIEFEGDKAFLLQSNSELGSDIDARNVVSRIVLLILHFPKLKIVWSRSLHATADLFLSLKSNQDEPEAAAAAMIGASKYAPWCMGLDGGPMLQGGYETLINQSAEDMLRR
eukprot:gene1794-33214_t